MNVGNLNLNQKYNYNGTENNFSYSRTKPAFCAQDKFELSQNKRVIDKINALEGDAFDNANEIKNIILESVGLPKDCIQVEVFDIPQQDAYCDYFNMSTGNILVHRNNNVDKIKLAKVIRHEIEHFMQSLAIVKNYGLDFYKKEYCEFQQGEIRGAFDNVSVEVNDKLWNNSELQNKVSISKERCSQYVSHMQTRFKLGNKPNSILKMYLEKFLYNCDPSEIDARKAEKTIFQ